MESSKDDRQATGEPRSTDGLQWRAAHSLTGQRQAGELMSSSDIMIGSVLIFFTIGPCSGCSNVGEGLVCVTFCAEPGEFERFRLHGTEVHPLLELLCS